MSRGITQIFASHTKLDVDFCDRLDKVAARVGVKIFRSEFEELENPGWKTIKNEMNKSSALFLLVGKELVNAQSASEKDQTAKEQWKFTQNWIAYEIGLACQRGLDVWVVCDGIHINFPVPYLNNYEIWGFQPLVKGNLGFFKGMLEYYCHGTDFSIGAALPSGWAPRLFTCRHCGAVFNLHSELPKGMEVPCPTCLKMLTFPDGWLL